MKKFWLVVLAVVVLSPPAFAMPEGSLLTDVIPGDDGMIDVTVVMPHQDDETIPLGGTIIKLKKDPRVRVHILCLTLGDMSDAKDWLGISSDELGRIRSGELKSAAAALGADEVIQFHYHDQGLAAADREKLVSEIREIIEKTGAEIVVTYEPAGVTGHTDHVAGSAATSAAFKGSPAQKLYYATLPRSIYYTRGMPLFQAEEMPDPVFPEFKVNIGKEKKLKRLAMYAHASQYHFSLVRIGINAAALLPFEYFALAAEN